MTDVLQAAPGSQQLVIDDLACIQGVPTLCQEYRVGFHLREGDVVQSPNDVSIVLQGANAQGSRFIPLFQGSSALAVNLQQRFSQALADHQGLLRAARSFHSLTEFFKVVRLGGGTLPLTPASFNQYLSFIFFGNYAAADHLQTSRNVALLNRVFDYQTEEFRLIHWYSLPYVNYNALSLPDLMSNDARLRSDLVRDWFALRSAFERRVNGLYLSGDQKERLKVLFQDALRNLYFGTPRLESITQGLSELAAELIQNTQQGSDNIYRLLEEVLSGTLDHRIFQTNRDVPAYNEAVSQERNATLAQRQPFASRELPQQRLVAMLQSLREAPLRMRFEFNQLENPIQTFLEAKSRELAQVENVGLILRDAFSHSSIQMGRIGHDWFTDNEGARIREILAAISFSEENGNPSAPLLLQSRPQALPLLSLRVARLRQAVEALIQRHPAQASEYRAAALGIMLQVYGNGRARNELVFTPRAGFATLRLPLDVDSRADLNAFYREIASSLGSGDAAQQAQSVAQWTSLALCVAGVGARVIYNSATGSWDGSPDALLGVSGAFCGYAAGTFGADLLGGNHSSNRILRNNIAGAATGLAVGLGAGFLPMAGNSTPAAAARPSRAMNARNPTSDFGP